MKEFSGYQKGINLGGWFSQCDNSEKRYDNFIKKEDFKRISRWGLDHVRIPVDYNLVQNEDLSFKENGFKRIEDCINWAKEYGLNMILDVHKTLGYSFDDGEKETGFFDNEKYQENFYKLWEEFAKRFNSYDNLSFELLNEVTDLEYKDTWNKIIKESISRIRVYAPNIKIIVGGCLYNNVHCIKYLDTPYDENIVFNFHCYDPLVFTHQGAYWVKNMPLDFRMNFDEPIEKYIEYNKQFVNRDYLEFDKDEKIDESYFEKEFKEAIEIAEKYNVPLYCGEYGVIDLARDLETIKWFKCINNVFVKYGIGRAVWNYKEMDFGLVDAHYDDIRDDLIKLL